MLSELQRLVLAIFFGISSLTAGGLALRALSLRQKATWASSFVWMACGAILWMISNGLGLQSTSLGVYDFFNRIDALGMALFSLGLLLFAVQWSLRVRRIPRALLVLLGALTLLDQGVLWSNGLHHWMWRTQAVPGGFASIDGPLFPLHLGYIYLILGAGLFLFLRAFAVRKGLFRMQAGLLLIGVLILLVASITVEAMGREWIPMVDEASIFSIFTILAFAYVTLRYRAFELMPAANQLILNNMRDGVIVLDQDGLVVMANRAAEEILGDEAGRMVGKPALDLLDHWSLAVRSAWPDRRSGREVEVFQPAQRHFRLHAAPLKDTAGQPLGELVTLYDISERKELELRLDLMAKSDPLTGSYNRSHFIECAGRLFRQAQRYHRPLSLAMLDLDHFQRVNEEFGEAVGDQMLKTVAALCLANLRRSDVFARYDGEEFVWMLPETGEEEARLVAQRLCDAIRVQEMEGGPVTASIGVVGILPGDSLTMEGFLDMAAQALQASKEAGRDRVTVWMD